VIDAISQALATDGCAVTVLEATEDFPQKLLAAAPDIVFNIAEGVTGRDREAQAPAILDYYGIPYTGSDAATLAVSLDKALTKRIAQSCGVSTPEFWVIDQGEQAAAAGPAALAQTPGDPIPGELSDALTFPVLVKPNAEGSSKGISEGSVATNIEQLRALIATGCARYGQDLLVERYVEGREFTVAVLGNGSEACVLEPMEIRFRAHRGDFDVYGYEVKQNFRDYVTYECPPDLAPEQVARLKRDAQQIYRVLGCRDMARVDFRLQQDETPAFIEINPLPGLAPGYSDFVILAAHNGLAYDDLIRGILRAACKRSGLL